MYDLINTYEGYLHEQKTLTVEEMQQIHSEMVSEIGNDRDALELYDELAEVATRYAEIRSRWLLMNREEKMDKDSHRTSCHNSVIVHFNMLSRYLKSKGKSAAWRDKLGYEEDDRIYRKSIGDFACYIVFVNSINAR